MVKSRRQDQRVPRTLQLAEEVATLSKRDVGTATVEVRTATDTFEEIVRDVLRAEHVEVSRVTIDREVDVAPKIRTEGDLTIVPILEEVLIVEKRLVLKEEVHIRRLVRMENVETPVTLRRQRAVVERLNSAGIPRSPETKAATDKDTS